jgi:hypothetical protein
VAAVLLAPPAADFPTTGRIRPASRGVKTKALSEDMAVAEAVGCRLSVRTQPSRGNIFIPCGPSTCVVGDDGRGFRD